MTDEIEACSCMHRIRTLQNLCGSGADPAALLIIPGIDGRNNPNSMSLLKYIFGGSIGIELFDSLVVDNLLDEMVLLIQRDSISVVYSSIAKKICGIMLSSCNLIEYLPLIDEETEIDSLQARKVCDFKRMMLDAVPAGSVIGMSIPSGYDTVQDVESWSLLQSFALDSNICPTGFFSSRYSVVDLSEYLNVIYRGVSESCLDRAIAVFRKSIIPHIKQSIALLESSSGLQRSHTTAGDIAGPLELLYEFGELVRSHPSCLPLNDSHRPVVLFGTWTSYIGTPEQCPMNWQDEVVGYSKHAVIEGSEPSTGLRFCRTYFLESGRTLPSLDVQGDQYEYNGTEDTDAVVEDPCTLIDTRNDAPVLERLKRMYVKLWLSLRATVRVAFQSYTDVLEAGIFIQNTMDSHMKGRSDWTDQGADGMPAGVADLGFDSADPYLREIAISETERLQVHMDCMNSFGEVISIEDVDEMGGVCWTYIRVSVHGIPLDSCLGGARTGAVSVGDTFLFSVAKKLIAEQQLRAGPTPFALPLLGDSFCVTHAVPYYRCLTGSEREERSARKLLESIKHTCVLEALSLGEPVDAASSSSSMGFESVSMREGQASTLSSVCVLTDHPLIPHMTSKLQLFTGGFVIEGSDAACLPILISIEHHVTELWTLDASECLAIAQSRGLIRNSPSGSDSEFRVLPGPEAPDGILIIMVLKAFEDSECETAIDTEVDATSMSKEACRETKVQYNALEDDNDEDEDEDDDDSNASRRGGGAVGASNATSDLKAERARKSMMFNPLKRSLSSLCCASSTVSTTGIFEPVCVAIFVPRGSRISAALRSPLVTWRSAMRSNGRPEHRGGRGEGTGAGVCEGSVPSSVLKAFVAAIDSYSMVDCSSHGSGFGMGLESAQTGMEDMLWDESSQSSSGAICLAGKEQCGLPGTGFLAMRSAHVLSESIRLQFSTAELQASLSRCHNLAKEASSQPLNATPKCSRRLLIVAGPTGCGVRAVGGLIKKQLSSHAEMQKCHVNCADINLTEIASACAVDIMTADSVVRAVEEMARLALTQPRVKGTTSQPLSLVTVVVLTIAPEQHIDQGNLIQLLLSAAQTCSPGVHVSLAAVVAVVAPKAMKSEIYTSPDITLDRKSQIGSFGFESMRGCIRSLFCVAVCDMAVIVDTPTGSASSGADQVFSECKEWILERNPEVEVVRLKVTSLRLDEETVESLLSSLKAPGSALCSAREAAFRVRYGPLGGAEKAPGVRMTHGPGPSSHLRLRTLRMPISLLPTAASSAPAWSVPSLLSVFQLLFPLATVSCSPDLLLADWRITSIATSPTASRGFKRLTELARAKVFSQRRFAEERRVQQLFLSEIRSEKELSMATKGSRGKCEKKRICRLRENVVSVQGTISVASSSSHSALTADKDLWEKNRINAFEAKRLLSFVSVEACPGSIIVRECEVRDTAVSAVKESETFLALGSFDDQLEDLLLDLFRSCAVLPLLPAAAFTSAGLTDRVIENIQLKYCGANNSLTPLPSGCWYDGKMFIDIHGNQSGFRPDINVFVDHYVIEKNKQILNYNKLLQSMQLP